MPASLPQLTVALKVDVKAGKTWGDMDYGEPEDLI
jgi:hypothetical protein